MTSIASKSVGKKMIARCIRISTTPRCSDVPTTISTNRMQVKNYYYGTTTSIMSRGGRLQQTDPSNILPNRSYSSHSIDRRSNANIYDNPNTIFRRTMVMITKTSANTSPTPTLREEPTTTNNSNDDKDNDQTQNDKSEVLNITSSAIRQVYNLGKQKSPSDPSRVYLRIYVDSGGCSGFEYKFELRHMDMDDNGDDDEEEGIDEEEDVLFQVSTNNNEEEEEVVSALVVIDEASLDLMKGSTLDFVQEMIRSSFAIVDNPLSESACGCGSSFAVKNFESNR